MPVLLKIDRIFVLSNKFGVNFQLPHISFCLFIAVHSCIASQAISFVNCLCIGACVDYHDKARGFDLLHLKNIFIQIDAVDIWTDPVPVSVVFTNDEILKTFLLLKEVEAIGRVDPPTILQAHS